MSKYECSELFAKYFSFWDKLTDSEKELLCANTVKTRYKKGSNVHGQAGECTGGVFVKSGVLRAYMMSENGREITLYRLFDGDICMLSASCILKAITFDVFVDAEEDSEVFIINPAVFSKLSGENIFVENFGLSIVADRFSEVMWVMQQILFMSFDRRLAIFLIDEASRKGSDTINYTKDQIAKYMGSAREVVSRMLKYFAGEGLVEVSRGGVKIIDRRRLMQIATH